MPLVDVPSPRIRLRVPEFASFYREHLGFVRHFVRRLGVHAAVDDVVQETFLTAYRRWGSLRPEASAEAWLATIARRVAHRHRRSSARNHRKRAALALASELPASPDAARRYDAARFLERFLASLDPGKREVFVLSEVGQLRTPEIAAELGLNANTVYTRLRVSRRLFVAAAEAQGLAPPETVIASSRAAERPSRTEVRRGWALLLPRLGEIRLLTGLGVASVPRLLGIVAGVVLAIGIGSGAAALGARRSSAQTDRDGRSAAVSGAPRPSAPRVAERDDAPAPVAIPNGAPPPTTNGDRIVSPSSGRPRPIAAPPVRNDVTTLPRSAETSTDAAASRTTPAREQEIPSASEDTDDVRLLERAMLSLERDPEDTLAIVRAHARRFPTSQLAEARALLEVRALCRRGDHEQAHARADVLAREHPGSNLARIARDDCGAKAPS